MGFIRGMYWWADCSWGAFFPWLFISITYAELHLQDYSMWHQCKNQPYLLLKSPIPLPNDGTGEICFYLELTLIIQEGLDVLCNAVFLWLQSDSWRFALHWEGAGMEPVPMACLWILVLQWGWFSLCFPYLYPKLPVLGVHPTGDSLCAAQADKVSHPNALVMVKQVQLCSARVLAQPRPDGPVTLAQNIGTNNYNTECYSCGTLDWTSDFSHISLSGRQEQGIMDYLSLQWNFNIHTGNTLHDTVLHRKCFVVF